MKRLMFIPLTLAAALIATSALAQPGRAPHAPAGRQEHPRMAGMEALNLTAEQKEKIHSIRTEAKKKSIDLRARQRIAQIELRELMAADTPDRGKIDAKVSEISKLHETMMRQHIDTALKIQQVLTPEQRQKAKELRAFARHGRHHRPEFRRHGPRFPRGMGPGHDGAGPFGDDEAGDNLDDPGYRL